MSGMLVSDDWLKSLPADLQTIVTEESKRWGASALKSNVDGAEKIFNDIRATGVEVTAIDIAPFRDAVKPVWDKLELTDLVAEVQKTLGN